MTKAVQSCDETQAKADSAGGASMIANPMTNVPRPSSLTGRQMSVDARFNDATKRRSIARAKPTNQPSAASIEGQHPFATQSPYALVGSAITQMEPVRPTPTPIIQSGRGATKRRPNGRTKPITKSGAASIEGQSQGETQASAALAGSASCPPKTGDPMPTPTLPSCEDHHPLESHRRGVLAGDDHQHLETQAIDVIPTIRELWRRRQSWHRAEKSLTLQSSGVCRRYVGVKDKGDKAGLKRASELLAAIEAGTDVGDAAMACAPLLAARDFLADQRKPIEKELEKMAITSHVAEWAKNVRGFGFLSLAALIGECGDVGSYRTVSCLWKRMGLAVIDGDRQRKVAGPDALEQGYAPQRRSVAWNIGVSLMRSQKPDDPYRAFYDREKAKQLEKGLTAGHAHNRACRHMTKRLLADLYGAWHDRSPQS